MRQEEKGSGGETETTQRKRDTKRKTLGGVDRKTKKSSEIDLRGVVVEHNQCVWVYVTICMITHLK